MQSGADYIGFRGRLHTGGLVRKTRVWAGAGIFSALLIGAGTAFAGYQWTGTFTLDPSEPAAWGTLGSIHSSSSDTYYMGCSITGQSSGLSGECHMKDPNGSGTCSAGAMAIEALRALNGDSYTDIIWHNGDCTNVVAFTASSYPYKSSGAAGTSSPQVSVANNVAKGAIGTVYNTSDTVQYIGCSVSSSGTTKCSAKTNDSTPVTFSCSSTDANILDAARAIKDDSYLEITKSGSTCTKLKVMTDSRYAPRR